LSFELQLDQKRTLGTKTGNPKLLFYYILYVLNVISLWSPVGLSGFLFMGKHGKHGKKTI
jgi:hypothetical protein